jgi:hypothetical protein
MLSICPKDFGDQHIDMTLSIRELVGPARVVIIVVHSATDPKYRYRHLSFCCPPIRWRKVEIRIRVGPTHWWMILAQITTDLASASQEALGRQSALLVLSLNCYAKYLTNNS